MSLTKKRQRELLKQYPDGNAIGYALTQDFIDQQIEEQSAGYQHVLNQEEIKFLLGVLPKIVTTDEEREAYNRYVRLRKALVKIINSWRFFFEMSLHWYYMTMYLFQGVTIGFKAILSSREATDDFWKICISELRNMHDNLDTAWENFRFSTKAMFYGHFIMTTLEELFGLDLTALRPNITLCEQNFKQVQTKAMETKEILEQYRKARGIKAKIRITPNPHTDNVFTRIQQMDIERLRTTEDKQYIIKALIETRGATAETMDDAVAEIYS